uniref:Putative ATPase domain containing protein n=1 Tax=viral metagenome TaxID=1070528 RepID=A0A6M3JKA8_9ZZZZ
MRPGLWIVDPETGEDRFIYYNELEEETIQPFLTPIGGFIFQADLFVRKKLPESPFYLRGWLPKRGKAYLYAPAKSGKSYLSMQLARCVGCGEDFLGIPTTKGSALYIQFELGEEILQHRMREETKKDYQNVYVGTTFSMKLDTKYGQERLWKAMEAVEPNVLILDPKIKMISGDENETHEMQPICDFLDSLIEGFNCSLLIIDHAGKDTSRRGRGSSIWEGWADSYIRMKRVSKKGEPLRVKIEPEFLRHASLPPNPIEAVLGDDFEFHVVSSAPTVKEEVSAYIEKCRQIVTPAQLFNEKIGSNTSVYQALGELEEEGKIEKVKRGEYKWKGGK